MRHVWWLALVACSPVEIEDAAQPCPAQTCLEGELGSATIGPGAEADGTCFSWTIGNDQALYINALTAENDGWFHHSNWFWVPESEWDLPDGTWNCGDHGFTELKAALTGGVLFAQSTQLLQETQQFLPGYVLKVPPRSRVIANAHLLNWSDEAQQTQLRTRFDLVPADEVEAVLAPWRFTYSDLDIPAGQSTEHGAVCQVRDFYEIAAGGSFDVRLHYLLPHFHGLGQGFTASFVGGPRDGEPIVEQRDAWGHPWGTTFAEPVDLSSADGIRFGCEHVNDTGADVGWGIGDQEMCVALLFAESRLMLESSVIETTDAGSAGAVLTRTGECLVIGAPFEP